MPSKRPNRHPLTTGEVAQALGTDQWRIVRLFARGELPEPGRVAGARAIPPDMLPAVSAKLAEHGWLPPDENGPTVMEKPRPRRLRHRA